jgi:hypothetical protein
MKELTQSEITGKWGPMLKSLGIPEAHIDKVSQYAHYHATLDRLALPIKGDSSKMTSVQEIDLDKVEVSTLPTAINILKNISDLSKVRFIRNDDPDYLKIKDQEFTISVTQDDIFKMKYKNPHEPLIYLEDSLVQKAVDAFNAMISNDWYIVFYLVVQAIKVTSEGTQAPKIILKSTCFFEQEPSQSLI